MRKAVIIPAYKAAETLPQVIDRLPGDLAKEGNKVIVVNDCCPERTGEVANDLARTHPFIEVIHHQQNRGYGGALKSGLASGYNAGFEIFPIVHADGQYAPGMALSICEPIENKETEIVQGSRMIGGNAREGGMPLFSRYLPNRILTTMENIVFGTSVAEFHSGYMVFSRRLLELVPYQNLQDNYNFDAEMMIMAHLCKIPIVEVPIPTRYDETTSSLNAIPYGLKVLRMMWQFTTGHYRKLLDDHSAVTGQHELV
jgi:glycosyltransferase involved in cell wall biosynthesis